MSNLKMKLTKYFHLLQCQKKYPGVNLMEVKYVYAEIYTPLEEI